MLNVDELKAIAGEPVEQYKFHFGECMLALATGLTAMYIVLTGLFSVFVLFGLGIGMLATVALIAFILCATRAA